MFSLDSILFTYWVVFILLPAPLLLVKLLKPYPSQRSALKFSFYDSLKIATARQSTERLAVDKASVIQKILLTLIWVLLLLALSKPLLVEEPITKEFSQRDLLIAVDLSGSMDTIDFILDNGQKVNRLQAIKELLNPFLNNRQGERIGMIFFGSAAFVQAPFTTDLNVLSHLLNEAQVAMAGPKTVIGDSIAMAIKVFEESKVKDRLLIVLTDGNDTSSKVPPRQAAQLAKESQIKIIPVAVGDPENAGENPIDKETLNDIAKVTGGQFFYALNRMALKQVLDEINHLMPKKVKRQTFSPTKDLYHWPVAIALLLLLIYAIGSLLFSSLRNR